MSSLAPKRDRLLAFIGQFESCAVALSGGVDSAVVAKAARLALGDRAVAVTGASASLPSGELAAAQELAQLVGIRHQVLATHEIADPNYRRNDPDRCYHCKSELYEQLEAWSGTLGVAVIFNGANADDLADYRPGMQAAREHKVRSPLAECSLTKVDVRALAADWELPIWDKPASPCLSSRIAYGEEVTPERLAMVDRAEQCLRALGLRELRVRFHSGELARIEVPAEAIPRLADPATRQALVDRLRAIGFRFVTLDLAGFQSGSLNTLLPLDRIRPLSG